MKSTVMKVCSWILTLVMLINMLPAHVLALDVSGTFSESSAAAPADDLPVETMPAATIDRNDASILHEIVDKRTEFSKEYKLANGLHMTVMYPEAVHYQADGQWEDVNSTLKTVGTRDSAVFTNTADAWQVMLPQTLSQDTDVSITADGYTISFRMAGELKHLSASSSATLRGQETIGNDLQVASAQRSAGAVCSFDYATQKAQSEYPETVLENLRSRLTYEEVYQNTDIIYDLSAGRLKESIVIREYDANLRGYRYILDADGLIPVLNDDGSIDLYARDSEDAIFTMPAPYMIDDAGEVSLDVDVTLESKNGAYILTYAVPTEWFASESRQWPVILDPVVSKSGHYTNVQDQTVMEEKSPLYTTGVNQCGWREYRGVIRSYVKFINIPDLSSADIIVEAYVRMTKANETSTPTVIEVRKVNSDWESSTLNWNNRPDYSDIVEDFAVVLEEGPYEWNITDIARGWYDTGVNTGMIFKATDAVEQAEVNNYVQFWSCDYDKYHPERGPCLFIKFRNSNGLESYWDYTATSAGRAGTGYVNNYTGNLTWVHNDLGFGGNLMPVSISHIYNAHDHSRNEFGLGYGWRTNYNQLVGVWNSKDYEVDMDEDAQLYYYWQDGDGTIHYFVSIDGTLVDEDGLNLTLSINGDDGYTITDSSGNVSIFDSLGRLVQISNNQATVSSIHIDYDGSSKRISMVTDGAERSYHFVYTGGLLSEIYYSGSSLNEEDIPHVYYTYNVFDQLTCITYDDGETSRFEYADHCALIRKAGDLSIEDDQEHSINGYYIYFDYFGSSRFRVRSIWECDGPYEGSGLSIEYAHNQTTFTDHNGRMEIMQFNDWGDVISVHDDLGRAQFAQYALNGLYDSGEYEENGATMRGHQLTLGSKLQNTVVNLLRQSSFEGSNIWTAISSNISSTRTSSHYYVGTKSLKMTSSVAGAPSGLYAPSVTVEPGESYTFSGYVKTGSSTNAFLALAVGGTVVATSETLTGVTTWTRLEVSYTNSGTTAVSLRPQFMTTTSGSTFLDCVQLEKMPTASRHNLLENGDFSTTYSWSSSSGRTTLDDTAAPHLSSNVYKFTGNPTAAQSISQTVKINGAEGDTLILSGWAKGDSAPLTDENRAFGLKLTFNYTDGSAYAQTVSFNTSCDSRNSWQYAAIPAVAEKAYSSVTVELLYSYNVNTVYFDGIQLFKEEFGTSYTYNDNGDVESVVDLQKKTTTYEYNAAGDLTSVHQANQPQTTYAYDDFHNLTRVTITRGDDETPETIVFEYTYDTWGNNTSVSMVCGNTRITTTAEYSDDGNRLVKTTDALANVTEYGYNEDTNVLDWVKYPEDTDASRTVYTYDDMYRMVQASTDVSSGYSLEASYTYTDDLLTEIETNPSTIYHFTYGLFDQTSSVRVGNRTLAGYTYTSDPDHCLQELTYGNGDSITYTYDDYGRVIKETFEDGDTVTYTYDNTGALATVTDSATGIQTTYYYDFTDRLMKYVEKGTNYSHSVGYEYDTLNNLTKLVETINGVEHTTSYTYDDDNRVTGSISDGIAQSYSYDSFGRVDSRTAAYNGGFGLYRNYFYATSSQGTSTQIVEYEIEVEGALITTTLSYDGNGNILSYDNCVNSTTYAYDSANQLVRENNSLADKTWVWTYDDAGNILSKKEYAYTTAEDPATAPTEVAYTYGDSSWGDLLTAYDGKPITYDGIGNPLTYDGWTFTWEHGRELSAMSKAGTTWQYTYDANGMRTSRTNGAITYRYIYNGGQLTQMHKGTDILHFVYDAGGTQVALIYNGSVYYYLTTLQGDTFAIADSDGTIVVEYIYDAWGKILSITGSMASTLGVLNPLRYRGYVYDHETGLYYLQSRYYNPEWGRFLNADAFVSTGQGLLGNNMFAYCLNNPIAYKDVTGTVPVIALIVVIAVIVIAGGTSIGAEAAMPSQEEHYARNANNPTDITDVSQLPEDWLTSDPNDKMRQLGPAANAHQFTSVDRTNVKYTSPDKHQELIFEKDDTLETDPKDLGTYNFGTGIIDHYVLDVKPWIRWGNSPDDTTTKFERMCGLIGIYWN